MFGKSLIACLTTIVLLLSSMSLAHGYSQIVRIGVFDIAPLTFMTAEGKYDGLAITMLKHIAMEEDYTLEYVHCDFSRCLELLESGDIDMQSAIAYSDERAKITIYNILKEG